MPGHFSLVILCGKPNMKMKQLIEDDNAVSPVIGVILMVAITVILAAVIGTFVLQLGQSSTSTTASAGVSVSGNSATLDSLGPSTVGIKCSGITEGDGEGGEGEHWSDGAAETIGESIDCSDIDDGGSSVVAYSRADSVENSTVHTFD